MYKTTVVRAAAIACFLLVATGCTTQQLSQQNDQVGHLTGIAILVDSTVTHRRTMKEPFLSITENDIIGSSLGKYVEDTLRSKGYSPKAPIHTIGMSSPAQLEVDFGKLPLPATENQETPPFLIAPAGSDITIDQIRNLFVKLNASKGESIPKEANPFGNAPVALISAQGYFFNDNPPYGFSDRQATNTLMVTGLSVSTGTLNINSLELDDDYIALSFRLYDPDTGKLIWNDETNGVGFADERTFQEEIRMMLSKIPDHAQ